jgi:glucose-1-phosphate thymidylyltransferase
MKALVLSGGAGTRLRPFSYSMPKQLIPVANKPVLEHVIENITDAGITEIGVIVGERSADIMSVLGDGSHLGVTITYIRQDQPLGLAHCVVLAREFIGDDDFVMYLGDNMLPGGIAALAKVFKAERPDAQLVVHKVPDPSLFGVAELGQDGTVLRVVEKPCRPRSDLALVGVYFFTQAIHRAVDAIRPSARGELEITDAIQWMITRGAEVRVTEYGDYWRDIGCVEDVLQCNRRILEGLRRRVAGDIGCHSVVTGPVVIEPGVRLVRSRIEGPAIIGAGTVVEDSYIGPYSSIGLNCVFRRTWAEYSIALEGAMVSDVRGLYASLIGRSATVGVTGDRTSRHRLVVGDHTRIELAA